MEFGHGRPRPLIAKGVVEGGNGSVQSSVGRDSDPVVVRRRGGSSASGPVGVGVPSGEDGGGDTVSIDGGDSISSSTNWWRRRYRRLEFGLELGSEALDLGLGLGITVQKPSYLGEGETALLLIVVCTLGDGSSGRRWDEASDGIPAGRTYLGLGDGETPFGLVTRGGILVHPGEWGGNPLVGYPQEGGTSWLLLLALTTLLDVKFWPWLWLWSWSLLLMPLLPGGQEGRRGAAGLDLLLELPLHLPSLVVGGGSRCWMRLHHILPRNLLRNLLRRQHRDIGVGIGGGPWLADDAAATAGGGTFLGDTGLTLTLTGQALAGPTLTTTTTAGRGGRGGGGRVRLGRRADVRLGGPDDEHAVAGALAGLGLAGLGRLVPRRGGAGRRVEGAAVDATEAGHRRRRCRGIIVVLEEGGRRGGPVQIVVVVGSTSSGNPSIDADGEVGLDARLHEGGGRALAEAGMAARVRPDRRHVADALSGSCSCLNLRLLLVLEVWAVGRCQRRVQTAADAPGGGHDGLGRGGQMLLPISIAIVGRRTAARGGLTCDPEELLVARRGQVGRTAGTGSRGRHRTGREGRHALYVSIQNK